ncbi:hypothetical protein FJZ18_02215 [Candidatus Pacearchaeota archaeon]|nr:hypothetical protein [Candidatus Pacearchaeota archaeon]
MKVHFIKSSEKKDIIEELREIYGIEELPFLLIETGKDKIRGFTGSLSKDEISELSKITFIEGIGLYLIRREESLRLSFDATQLLNDQINKSALDVSEEQAIQWLKGNDLDIKCLRGIVVVMFENIPLGCGKSTGERIVNHVPKERRLRK